MKVRIRHETKQYVSNDSGRRKRTALVINFVNSLDELTDDHYQIDVNQEDAEIDVVFTEELSHDGSLLLRSLILGLTSVEEEHEQYLDVIFKEV